MTSGILKDNPENTHQAVLFHLKRQKEMTVADLCEALGITSMAVRRHLSGLQADGLVDARLTKVSRGRPTYRYKLTEEAEKLFPSAINNFAVELLDAVYEAKGSSGVAELLELRDEAVARRLLPLLEGLGIEERVAAVVKIFSENGYMTEFKRTEDGGFFIYQQHCAVHNLAIKYPAICGLEGQLLEKLLGVKAERTKYLMDGDQVCGYLVQAM